jgi:predicted lipoprotein with Yx(FWY)xxD motif
MLLIRLLTSVNAYYISIIYTWSNSKSWHSYASKTKWRIGMKNKLLLSSLTIFTLIISACASATPVPSVVVSSSGAALVNVGQNPTLGSFLVDSKGMTLYLYTKDTPNTSNCYGGCAGYWPPLLTNGAPAAATGVTASMLGTTRRTDGTTQVTYNGWPLYYYKSDKVVGDTTGENVQSVWFVITPAGAQK